MLEQEHILLESVMPYSMITRIVCVARHYMFLCICAYTYWVPGMVLLHNGCPN